MPNERNGLFLNGLALKIIAMVTMTFDHVGYCLQMSRATYEVGLIFRFIGRIAFPLFVFLMAEGMRHTRHPWRYVLRIALVYAIITFAETLIVYPFSSVFGFSADSLDAHAFTDLLLIVTTLACLRLKGAKKLFALIPIAICIASFGCGVYDHYHAHNIILWFPRYLRAGYSLFGLLLGIAFYYVPDIVKAASTPFLKRNNVDPELYMETTQARKAMNSFTSLFLLLVVLVFWGLSYMTPGREIGIDMDMSIQTYCLLSIFPISFYNGTRGPDSKAWRVFSYLYFPVHLIIIYGIFALI